MLTGKDTLQTCKEWALKITNNKIEAAEHRKNSVALVLPVCVFYWPRFYFSFFVWSFTALWCHKKLPRVWFSNKNKKSLKSRKINRLAIICRHTAAALYSSSIRRQHRTKTKSIMKWNETKRKAKHDLTLSSLSPLMIASVFFCVAWKNHFYYCAGWLTQYRCWGCEREKKKVFDDAPHFSTFFLMTSESWLQERRSLLTWLDLTCLFVVCTFSLHFKL